VNVFNDIRAEIIQVIEALCAESTLPEGLDLSRVAVDVPRDSAFGDLSTNAAMVLARPAGLKPRDLAQLIIDKLERVDGVASAEVAGPGFINLRLDDAVWRRCLAEILKQGSAYGDSNIGGGEAVNVEFVSANPTGPLHIGHARGSVFGDVLASLLQIGESQAAGLSVDEDANVKAAASSAVKQFFESLRLCPSFPGYHRLLYALCIHRGVGLKQ